MKDIVERYIQLRDAKAKIVKQTKEKTELLDTHLDKLEALIMEQFNAQGIDSAKTASGTAYKQVRTSARVLDWDATLEWIKANNAFEMLKRDIAKAAVEAYRDEHQDLPPGLDWREEVVINVRRA